MKTNLKITMTLAALLTFTTACSHTETQTAADPATTNVAATAGADLVTEIEFDKSSSELSEDAKKEIFDLVKKAHAISNVDEVRVVTWADREYPMGQKKKLPAPQRKLADARNTTIEKYIKTIPEGEKLSVETYSMATRPNLVSEWLNTPDARMKTALAQSGLPTDGTPVTGKASRSIVMVLIKE